MLFEKGHEGGGLQVCKKLDQLQLSFFSAAPHVGHLDLASGQAARA